MTVTLWGWDGVSVGVVLLAALVYWQLVLAEGAYLGRSIVTLMYDWSARSYDRIKGFDEDDEADRLGYPLAERLAADIASFAGSAPDLGHLDIALYRDDVGTGLPVLGETHLPFDVSARPLILVDDVLYTGRTTRAAIDALFDFGRPPQVQLAVLVDRGHRELPIRPDYTGKNLPTARHERVHVHLAEVDGADEVILHERAPEEAA